MVNEGRILIQIDLSLLRLDEVSPFDFYLQSREDDHNYVLYSKNGSRFTEDLKQELLLNGVKTIYVTDSDYDAYQEYIENNLSAIIHDEDIGPQEKSKIVYSSSKYLMKKLFEDPRIDNIVRTKKTVDHLVDIVLSDSKTTQQLIRITEFDYSTYTHSINVGIISLAFAKDLLNNISEDEFHDLGTGFFLHDIGKAAIPLEIINKSDPLSSSDWMVMKTHPQKGYEILKESGFLNMEAASIVLQHHERIDGSGYPKGLKGGEISFFGKICSIVDSFDALTTNRCYQKAHSSFDALNIIKEKMINKQFDHDVFSKFVAFFSGK